MRTKLRRQRGNMALVGALAAVPLALAAGYGVELSGIANERAMLQAAADSGALAGAGELSVLTRGVDGIERTVQDFAQAQLGAYASQATVTFTVEADRVNGMVHVGGRAERPSTFGFLGAGPVVITVSATAAIAQSSPLCILQTNNVNVEGAVSGLVVQDRAQVRAPTCLVHANHNLDVTGSGGLLAGVIQASGRVSGPVAGNSGALPIADPFRSLDLRPPMACPENPPVISVTGNTTRSLSPGVHCNDFRLLGNATLQLQPGEHWFLGEIGVRGNARLRGDDVALIFGGDDEFHFGDRADVELTARRTGPYAGFLIMTTRDNDETFTIASDRVRELLGTIYIPNAHLVIATSGSVAQDSAWSVIVANTLQLREGPLLVINTGYVGSGVPVPEGVGPTAGEPRLTR